ncbi:MAG: NigD-like protein [Candidatus Cryptobacteroides sp.]
MKRKIGIIIAAAASALLVLSCSKDNGPDYSKTYLNWIVTCKTSEDGKFYLQLDNTTTGLVENISKPLYDGKQVRALANLSDKGVGPEGYDRLVAINRIDSIRTKAPVPTEGDLNDEKFGTAPVEIYRSWLTLVEDDYLNLCFQTFWGPNTRVHYINLLTGTDPDDPYVLELRHDSNGDTEAYNRATSIVAFDLRSLPDTQGKTVKLTLNYQSFSGKKSIQFDYCSGKATSDTGDVESPDDVDLNLNIE